MKVYCCYTPAHEVLYRDYFRPSLASPCEVVPRRLEIPGAGDFLSAEFLRCIREKMRLIRESVAANASSVIIWSDVDIVFLGDVLGGILPQFEKDPQLCLLLQHEAKRLPDVNTGFIAMRCCSETDAFFERVERRLTAEAGKNEQAVVNDLLLRDKDAVKWDYLPWSFYARTHGWPPPSDIVLYHANYTKGSDGVGQKISQFKEFAWVQKRGWPALAWSCLRRLPGRLVRLLAR